MLSGKDPKPVREQYPGEVRIANLFRSRYLHAKKKDAYTRRNRRDSSILQGEWSLIQEPSERNRDSRVAVL